MAILHEYAESNSKTGYYLREGYDGAVITYQVPDLAEDILLNLGYGGEDRIAEEVFYILLNLDLIYTNQSGVEPVESLDDLPTSENDEISALSSDQRQYLVKILFEQMELTTEQREKLTGYADSSDTKNGNQISSTNQKNENNTRLFESRIDDYDEYMLAVDMARLLKPATERLDIPENPEESELLSELKSAEKRRDELYEVSKKHPENLRAYRDEQGTPEGVTVLEKDSLNEDGLSFPTGDGEEIKITYNIPAKNYDIVVPKDWTIPPVRSKSDSEDVDICFEDLPDKTQEQLMNRARKEVLGQVVEFLEDM